jgi:ketosteroid isomerase-like protein
MNFRTVLVYGLVLGLTANAAYARYERALDGKTKIWRDAAQKPLQASWSGDRDAKGYATGDGTLTWFRTLHGWETGSLLPKTKYIQVSQYRGNMVEGKLEGSVVRTNARGDIYHARFADGKKTGDWIAGEPRSSSKRAERESPPMQVAAESPAEAPPPAPKLEEHPPKVEEAASKIEQHPTEPKPAAVTVSSPAKPTKVAVAPSAKSPVADQPIDKPSSTTEESLQALAKPPSSLRLAAATKPQQHSEEPSVVTGTNAQSPASVESAPANSKTDDDARTVAALDSEYQAAVKTNDAGTIDRILADDFALVQGSGQTLSKTDVLNRARDKQARYERHEIEDGSQKVRVWRDTAVVTETLWVKGTQNGKPIDQKIPVTETYVRTAEGWRYVSGQAAVPSK